MMSVLIICSTAQYTSQVVVRMKNDGLMYSEGSRIGQPLICVRVLVASESVVQLGGIIRTVNVLLSGPTIPIVY